MLTREVCKQCGDVVRVGFEVPNELWNIVIGDSGTVRCLNCFTKKADEMMLPWDENISFYPVSQLTHLKSEYVGVVPREKVEDTRCGKQKKE